MRGRRIDEQAERRAEHLIRSFVAGRREKTARAYIQDVGEFARFLGQTPASAIARLLADGPGPGRQLILEYARALRSWGRAPSTIHRRLTTLHGLVSAARSLGLVDWVLEGPRADELQAGAEVASATESRHYLLPRHPSEIDRLDLQYYAIRLALGANHQAPVEAPERILDVGAGSGQWGFDMTEEFPDALVVGLDLVPGKPDRPPRYRPVRADLLRGLPFLDGTFDLVHQRLLFLAIPAASWPAVVHDLFRVTRPGGWIELVEPPLRLDGAGPAIERLLELSLAAAAARGLDTSGTVHASLDGYLRQAGVREVQRREVKLPVGEWGGEVGSLMATDFRTAFSRLLEARSDLDPEERTALLQRVQEEYEERHVTSALAIAFGRRPA